MDIIKKTYHFAAVILAALVVWGCVNEDREDCDPVSAQRTIRVFYSFQQSPSATRVLDPTEIEIVTLYVFDHLGDFVEKIVDDQPEFGGNYYTDLELEPGTYTIISWLNNMEECYGMTHPDDLEDFQAHVDDIRLRLLTNDSNTVDKQIYNLFHGRIDGADVAASGEHIFTVPLIRDTYEIYVSTIGLPKDDDDYNIVITDRNAILRFDNSVETIQEIIYTSGLEKDRWGQLSGFRRVLRLREDLRHARLSIVNTSTGKEIFEDNLIELILSAQGLVSNPFDKIYEYHIQIRFDLDMKATVTVNGWKVVIDDNDLDI